MRTMGISAGIISSQPPMMTGTIAFASAGGAKSSTAPKIEIAILEVLRFIPSYSLPDRGVCELSVIQLIWHDPNGV